MKWAAVLLSVTLLAVTLLLVHARRSQSPGVVLPASAAVELARPVVGR